MESIRSDCYDSLSLMGLAIITPASGSSTVRGQRHPALQSQVVVILAETFGIRMTALENHHSCK